MSLFVWEPEGRPVGSLVLLHEIFGVGPYIRAVAERLQAAGFAVGAPDLFWRFAPNWQSDHSAEGLAKSIEKVQQLDFQQAAADSSRALDAVRALAHTPTAPAVLGFCLGGTLAWAVAAASDPSCCVSYYGSGVPGMIGLIEQVECPTLFHFGNADSYIPNEGIELLSKAIEWRDRFTLNVEDAGHAFDNHESEMFWNEAAAKSAWAKTMSFLTEHATS
ncbi:MAG: dienelactone hydrolase family protein [Ilumatobacteraceae bacterium]